jgi:hypothetical protein
VPGLLRSRAPLIARKAPPPAPAMSRRAGARALLALATATALAIAARPAAACFETVNFAALDAGAPFSSHGHAHGRTLHAEEGAAPWNYRLSGADWPGECLDGRAQSPIAFATSAPELVPLPAAARAALDLPVVSGMLVFNNGCAPGGAAAASAGWPIGLAPIPEPQRNAESLRRQFLLATADNQQPRLLRPPLGSHAIQGQWEAVAAGGPVTVAVGAAGWGEPAGADAAGATRYLVDLLQWHIHSACEHVLDGETCPLEIHLVGAAGNASDAAGAAAGPRPPGCEGEASCLLVFGVRFGLAADPCACGRPPLWRAVKLVKLARRWG